MDKIAYIDLGNRSVEFGQISDDLRRRFLGGRGINTYLLYRYVNRATDPVGPENVLLVGPGVLTGLPWTGASRVNFSAKSPETGHLGDSAMGGYFGAELRFAGFDLLVIRGRSPRPVYLFVNDGRIEFRDASHLAELDTVETQNQIRKELGDPRIQVVAIGPAGRKLVRWACIMHGVSYSAGRTGMGTVMGSKNLWGIACRGTQDIPVANPERFMKVVRDHYGQVTSTKGFYATSIYGTLIRLNNTRTQGYEGGRNHQFNMLETGGEEMDADVFLEKYESAKGSCYSCPTHCKHMHKMPGKDGKPIMRGGPEYYGAGGWGSQCGCNSWETILTAWNICNGLGLDVGSATAYTAWVMELYEKGILTRDETGGLALEWGSPEAILGVLDQVMKGEGIGGVLAKGWKEAARVIGKGSERYFDHVKGLSIECDDIRGHRAQVLGLATSSRGADHLRSRFTLEEFSLPEKVTERLIGVAIPPDPAVYEKKEYACFWTEVVCSLADALGICKFLTKWLSVGLLGLDEFADALEAARGWGLSRDDLIQVGRRIYSVERMFLVREGLDRKDDAVPEKFFKPWTHGPRAGTRVEQDKFDALLDRYYLLHGWDSNGVPREETLQKLQIGELSLAS